MGTAVLIARVATIEAHGIDTELESPSGSSVAFHGERRAKSWCAHPVVGTDVEWHAGAVRPASRVVAAIERAARTFPWWDRIPQGAARGGHNVGGDKRN
ncbi:hypothetical protein L226DRAFT_62429 [Lentinus tigrinus ALCF2SS1-7]|uniref:uncharacterized protein n=1 Tax=Lentinus tigrinus ALCF2SS1-7 TaxID=1328758 RepID=UPI001165E074|nr:hypothetical protein L226DRAFT_62429 [Lentinus tigrinus ALCF2SS1-7]